MQESREHIIGFRIWPIDRANCILLPWSHLVQPRWVPGVNEAVCQYHLFHKARYKTRIPPRTHVAPDPDCECGLYAHHWPQKIQNHSSYLYAVGAIRGWGRVEIHGDGWRAQKAEVIALIAAHERPARKLIERVAYAYSVPVVENTEALENFAKEYGQLVPEELRPSFKDRMEYYSNLPRRSAIWQPPQDDN